MPKEALRSSSWLTFLSRNAGYHPPAVPTHVGSSPQSIMAETPRSHKLSAWRNTSGHAHRKLPPCDDSGGRKCPTIVLCTLYELRWGWLGSGLFWPTARSWYKPLGKNAYVMNARTIREHSAFSENVWYSLEKVGFANERSGVDWALVREGIGHTRGLGLQELASRYDYVLAYAPALRRLPPGLLRGPGMGKVVLVLDEPPPFTFPSAALDSARVAGACSGCALSHFLNHKSPDTRVRHFPPPYEESRFAPFVRNASARAPFYFMAKRTLHSVALEAAMQRLRYSKLQGESWKFTGNMTYQSYVRRLATARWVIAEAAMLGIPIISVVGKTNADLLLPPELLLPRSVNATAASAFVARTVAWYDARPHAYAALAHRVRYAANSLLRPPHRLKLAQQALDCCADPGRSSSPDGHS